MEPRLWRRLRASRASGHGGSVPVVRTDPAVVLTSSLDITIATQGTEAKHSTHLVLRPDGLGIVAEFVSTTSPAFFMPSMGHVSEYETAVLLGRLDVENRLQPVVDALSVVDPRLTGVTSVPYGSGSAVHADIGLGRKLPIAMLGEGVARLLDISVRIAAAKGGILLVDEIENGFHHSVMPDVWRAIAKAARENDCQVIATTHSQECIDAAHEAICGDEEQDLAYIRLAREGERTKAYTFEPDVLATAMDRWMEVR